MNVIATVIAAIFLSSSAFATELKDVSLNAESTFTGCAVENALNKLGPQYEVWDIMGGSLSNTNKPALLADLKFSAGNAQTGEKKIFKIVIRSMDAKKGWQARTSEAGAFLYSTKVSSMAALKLGTTKLADLDLSLCH